MHEFPKRVHKIRNEREDLNLLSFFSNPSKPYIRNKKHIKMNKELIDKKDLRILALENTIRSFKEYDAKRKEYYKESLIRLGELESLLSEIEEGNDKDKQTIIAQRKMLNKLNLIIKSKDLEDIKDYYLDNEDELQNLKEKEQNVLLKKRNKELKKENRRLKETVSYLLSKLNKNNG